MGATLDYVAIGGLITGLIAAIVGGIVTFRKQVANECRHEDGRADAAWRETNAGLNRVVDELKAEHRDMSTRLVECKEEHARTDERLKHVEKEAKECAEDRKNLFNRVTQIESKLPKN